MCQVVWWNPDARPAGLEPTQHDAMGASRQDKKGPGWEKARLMGGRSMGALLAGR